MQKTYVNLEVRRASNAPISSLSPPSDMPFYDVKQSRESMHTHPSWIDSVWDYAGFLSSAVCRVSKVVFNKTGIPQLLTEVDEEMELENLVLFEPIGLEKITIQDIAKMPQALCVSLVFRASEFIKKHHISFQECVDELPEKIENLTAHIEKTQKYNRILKADLSNHYTDEARANLQHQAHNVYCQALDSYSIGVTWIMLFADENLYYPPDILQTKSTLRRKAKLDECVLTLREELRALEKIKQEFEVTNGLEFIALSDEYKTISDMLKPDFVDDATFTMQELPKSLITLSFMQHLLNIKGMASQRATLLGENWCFVPSTKFEQCVSKHQTGIYSTLKLLEISSKNQEPLHRALDHIFSAKKD